jgi:hypothetical protein
MSILNARISSTSLGSEDHGIFTAWIYLDYGSSGQGFGGYALDGRPPDRRGSERPGTAYGMEYIIRILRTLKVERWEKLPGTYCRVETEGDWGPIIRIGHVLENRWFDPRALADELLSLSRAPSSGPETP